MLHFSSVCVAPPSVPRVSAQVFLKLTAEDEALRNPLTRDLARDELLLPRVPSFGEMSIVSLGEWDAAGGSSHWLLC